MKQTSKRLTFKEWNHKRQKESMATERGPFPWGRLISLVLSILWLVARWYGIALPEEWLTYVADGIAGLLGGGAAVQTAVKAAKDKANVAAALLLFACLPAHAEAQEPFEIYPDTGLMSQFDEHLTCERHYYHCSLWSYQSWSALGQCRERMRDACSPIRSDELWKPVSESHGTPALLLDQQLYGQKLSVEDEYGNRVGSVIRMSCCNNGNRAHWFLGQRCDTLPSPLILRVGSLCRRIEDPCSRYGN